MKLAFLGARVGTAFPLEKNMEKIHDDSSALGEI